uniref:hypothetical protein n=1 Tax=Yeosuana sp. TaxID=2529388 RepID=UPI004054B3BF
KHNLKNLPKTFQLYGYGQFDENKPNLKQDFEAIGSDSINGKYLYDKTRDLFKGKPIIKLNAYYKSIILLYIGYDDFKKFMDDNNLSQHEEEKQLSLIYDNSVDRTYYYINYYFGEDNMILKGQTIISDNWKKIKHTFIYPQDDGSMRDHYNFGNIIRREDTLHINTKTLLDGKLVEGANEIYYIGHKTPSTVNFLVGTYCTFDIYTNTVAGQSILEKCVSKEDMLEKSNSPNIPPYIAMEIRNKRIVNNRLVPNSYLELSNKSPFSSIYAKIPGTYELSFNLDNNLTEVIKFKILATNYKIITLTENVYIEKDRIELLNKGTVINFRFTFSGIITLERVNIYFKTYYLKNEKLNQEGVFSGIDNENRLINGTLDVNYVPN